MTLQEEIKLIIDGYLERGMKDKKKIIDEIKKDYKSHDDQEKVKQLISAVTKLDLSIKEETKEKKKEKKVKKESKKEETKIVYESLTSLLKESQKEKENELKKTFETTEGFTERLAKELKNNTESMSSYLDILIKNEDVDAVRKLSDDLTNTVLQQMNLSTEDLKDNGEDLKKIVDKHVEYLMRKNTSIFKNIKDYSKRFFNTEFGKHLKQGFDNVLGTVKGHFDTILGDFKTLIIDPIMNMGKTTWNMFKSFKNFGEEMEDGDVVTHSLLDSIFEKLDDIHKLDQKMFGLDKKEFLKDARTKEKSSKGLFGDLLNNLTPLGLLITGIGVLLGSFIRHLTLPFEVLMKFTGTLKPFIGLIGKVKNFISPFIEILTTLPALGKYFKLFFSAFKIGFKTLGLPLQILLSTIDFFKGFFGSSETTFLGKIKDGVKQVFLGFFEPFIDIGNWISDMITPITFPIYDFVGKMSDFVETVFTSTISAFENFFQTIIDLPTKLSDYIYNLLPWWLGGKTKEERELEKKKAQSTKKEITLYKIIDKEQSEIEKIKIEKNKEEIAKLKSKEINPNKLSFSKVFSSLFGIEPVAKMQTGGLTRKEGLAYIHPNEIVGPVNTIIPQLVKEVMVNNANSLKESKIIEKTISSPSKGNVTVINNNTVNKQAPPTDIESMSLIMYNTSWGFA